MNQEENTNNSQTTETSTYQIPGVIIPDQVTDSGEHLSTQPVQETQPIPEKETPPQQETTVYQIPGVIIPEQTTDNGKIETVNNVTEENIYKAPEKEVVNTTEKPLMPGMMPEKKEEAVVKEKTKKVKKEGNAKLGCLYLVIIVLGVASLFLAYKAFLNPKVIVTDDVKTLNEKIYNKKGLVVNELYDWINLTGCNNLYYEFYNPEVESITRTDLSDEFKLYMAYLQIKNKNMEEKTCSNYSAALHKNDKDKKWFCGTDYLNSKVESFDDTNSKTKIIDSKLLKEQVEKMFGKGSYKKKSFSINSDTRYVYDESNEKYILQSKSEDVKCNTFTTKLTEVTNGTTEIGLKVLLTIDGKEYIKFVVFEKSQDGNYYFNRVVN